MHGDKLIIQLRYIYDAFKQSVISNCQSENSTNNGVLCDAN